MPRNRPGLSVRGAPSGVRNFSLGTVGPADLVNIGVLILFAVLMWRLAVWRLEARLID